MSEELQAEYDQLKKESEVLAGGLTEIPRRVSILTHIYQDSGKNHTFPLIAAHGALWAMGYFEAGGSLGRLISWRYAYSSRERAYRIGILREFAEGFRGVNRLVCIDTLTNYRFTKHHGEKQGADSIIPPELLEALNKVHHARRTGKSLEASDRKKGL